MYKVFFKDRIVFFTDSESDCCKDEASRLVKFSSRDALSKEVYHFMHDPSVKKLYLLHNNTGTLKEAFRSLCRPVPAAGGVVNNAQGEILFIRRHDLWDLPKGKLEVNEQPDEGACREVIEETGVKDLKILSPLSITYHCYLQDNELLLKDTHWYRMETHTDQNFRPQLKESITEVRWMSPEEFSSKGNETFPLIHDVIHDFISGPSTGES